MEQKRYTGKLTKWNAERGFGFIKADDGGLDIFVHITAFSRQGGLPQEGEALSFEVKPDRNGKRSAIRVHRPGEPEHGAMHRRQPLNHRTGRRNAPGWVAKLMSIMLLVALAFFAYSQYSKHAAVHDSVMPGPPPAMSPGKLTVPVEFKCDGRSMCSQMTSCREATLFLQNCPDMQLDGNHDGIPCEQQWCIK